MRAGTPRPTRPTWLLGIVVAAVLLVLLVPLLASYYVDWLWFREVRLLGVFWRSLKAEFVVGPLLGVLFFAIFYGNVELARRLAPAYRAAGALGAIELPGDDAKRLIRLAGLAVSLIIAAIVATSTSSSWLVFLKALHAVPFKIADPVFHRDIGFYVFELPAWKYLYDFSFASLLGTLVAAFLVHVALGGLVLNQQRIQVQPRMLSHLSVLLGVIFALTGFGYLIKAWELLYSTHGVVFGAGYTDVHARLPSLRILTVISWAAAALMVANVRLRRRMLPPMVIGGWLVALIVLSSVYPAALQSLVVNPNQGAKETEFIRRNIQATRAAYDLEHITRTNLSLKGDMTAEKLKANDVTIRNIRLWDPATLRHSYQQLQELRPYYSFVDVDVDRYKVNGVYREVMLSARQMNIAGLPQGAQTWVNQHITFTHGYGVAVSAVNQVTSDGSPDFLVQDIPVTSSAPSLKITEPRIYYGEIGTEYSLVRTKAPEFDYPGPDGDMYQSYEGKGGIPIGPLLNKICFGIEFGTIKFITSSAITPTSRIIILNNIRERLAKAAWFLRFDSDPYMVVANGRLYWIADAYTTTSRYPYSQPTGDINYMRNSVKAVVDATDGTLTFYAFDPADPLLRTYERIFPGMFHPRAEMPEALMDHVRYPEDFFAVQAEVFATYHVTSPSVFYNKGDQWEVPARATSAGSEPMDAYYVIMRLPGEAREEFVLISPFSPNGRSNMIGWLGAQSDVPHYGDAVSFTFPSSQTVYGPAQVEAAVNQDPTISSQRTLWGQQGSRVIFGNLLVVPVEDSLLYVQPMYLESEQTKLPQFKRVVVFYRAPAGAALPPSGQQQNVIMASSLGDALSQIFGSAKPAPVSAPPSASLAPASGQPTTAPTSQPPSQTSAASNSTCQNLPAQVKALIAQANEQYESAEKSLKAGDFSGYGSKIEQLQGTLKQLEALR